MKALFSPAISLMNKLNYRKKFALLGIVSLMAISVLIYSLFLGLNQVVQKSQRQLQGLKLITPISKAIQGLQLHRGQSASFLGGTRSIVNTPTEIATETSNHITTIENSVSDDLLIQNEIWKSIKSNWVNIVANGLNWTVSENFSGHTQLIDQLQQFKVLLADEYALTFNSEIDTFYVIDTSINKLPRSMEQLAQLRDFSTRILSKKQATDFQRNELIALIAKLESSLSLLTTNLNKIAIFNISIGPQLAITSTNINQSTHEIIKLIQSDILEGQFVTPSEYFFSQVTAAINSSHAKMYQTLLPTARSLITARLEQAKNRLYISIAVSLMLMMIVLYFVIGIYLSMKGSVQSLSRSLQLFANGDLQERINIHTQDELEPIANSFNQLAEKITSLLDNVESSQKKMQQVLDGLLTMAGILLPNGTLDFANSTPLQLSGLKQEDVLGKKLWDCPWFSHNSSVQDQIRSDCQLAAQGEAVDREIEFALLDSVIWVDFSVHPVLDEQGAIKFLVAEARDATRRRLAEEHSKRSQKMDALGKLVGGIAHDYNNMLGVILGYAELLEMKCDDTDGVKDYINEIIRAGDRGRVLTRKMLAFSKSESSNPDICNINSTLHSLKDMLAKSLTASINLEYNLQCQTWPVWVDANDLEDAILNMSINAKYAMPEGGSLTIKTENVTLTREEAKLLGLSTNDYLKLSITDTGCGMDEETKNHVFDPFFTTKGEAGNGLGLSQVFGFVERSGGAINISTQLGEGSQFNLYFPRYHTENKENKTFNSHSAPQLAGDDCILVVDDEPALRELAKKILTHFGYRVLTANSGEAALNILAAQPVDLMISDVIMPKMDGYQLARQVIDQYPSIKILLASGFSDIRHTDSNQNLRKNMLNKPYTSKELLTSIRLLLDGYLLPKDTQ